MKINKFGGAAVKDAAGIKNVVKIIQSFDENSIVIVSAIGKTTNLLEKVCNYFFDKNTSESENPYFQELKQNHIEIVNDLFEGKAPFIMNDIENILLELECFLEKRNKPEPFDFYYDQIIPYGELLSSRILAHYLNFSEVKTHWIDSRNFITTDDNYREARVDWDTTNAVISGKLLKLASKSTIVMQGFIARSHLGTTTTLGREGSDYTAAILAHSLNSKSVTIWKDVEGVMNADPKRFPNAQKIKTISFNEAIELAYYGATVIHPKTIQPLKNKKIPLLVKSFINPQAEGTVVLEGDKSITVPCTIVKENQVLLSIKSKDLSFIAEQSLQHIFSLFATYKQRINVMQNSAISFTCCTDYVEHRVLALIKNLKETYDVEITKNLKICTTYNVQKDSNGGGKILLRQKTGNVLHDVIEN